jgi:DNA topoisomerase-3
MILGREIPKNRRKSFSLRERPVLLEGFISKRGRPFSAYLKLEDGKVGFEFPEKTASAAESK